MLDMKLNRDVLTIKISGELDHHSAAEMREAIDGYLSNNQYASVVWDFGKLSFMDSTGVGLLMGRYRRLKQNRKAVYIKDPTPAIDKVLKVSGIYTIIPKI